MSGFACKACTVWYVSVLHICDEAKGKDRGGGHWQKAADAMALELQLFA